MQEATDATRRFAILQTCSGLIWRRRYPTTGGPLVMTGFSRCLTIRCTSTLNVSRLLFFGQNWVEKAKQGEPAAIAELYRCYWRAARATAYGMTGPLGKITSFAASTFRQRPGLYGFSPTASWIRAVSSLTVPAGRPLKQVSECLA